MNCCSCSEFVSHCQGDSSLCKVVHESEVVSLHGGLPWAVAALKETSLQRSVLLHWNIPQYALFNITINLQGPCDGGRPIERGHAQPRPSHSRLALG